MNYCKTSLRVCSDFLVILFLLRKEPRSLLGKGLHHWKSCQTLRDVFRRLYGVEEVISCLDPEVMKLQRELDGDSLQRVVASWHAIWKCRCVLSRGLRHHNFDDLCQHVKNLFTNKSGAAWGDTQSMHDARQPQE